MAAGHAQDRDAFSFIFKATLSLLIVVARPVARTCTSALPESANQGRNLGLERRSAAYRKTGTPDG